VTREVVDPADEGGVIAGSHPKHAPEIAMCLIATHLAWLLNGTLLTALGGSSSGCNNQTCPEDMTVSSVSSQLLYTEPTAALDARIAELEAGTAPADTLNAERARGGTARVVNEARTFNGDSVDVSDFTITLTSTVSYSATVAGETIPLPLSTVTVYFDKPSGAGLQSLLDLHGMVCENIQGTDGSASDPHLPACGDTPGTITFHPSGDVDFDADLVFSSSGVVTDDPSLEGSAHVHYEITKEEVACGGGNAGPAGVFAP
jgi:hypothetical protein